MKKMLLIFGTILCSALAVVVCQNRSMENEQSVSLEGVEAVAGCEISSNDALNVGGCVAEIGGAGEICAAIKNAERPCWKTI